MPKPVIWVPAALLVLGTVLFLAGPRPEIDETIRPVALPAALRDFDRYLAGQEARVPDLRPNVEKTIVWADPDEKARTPISIVYLHGFSATRQESAPLSDTLAARLGANLYYARLRGHGRSDDALAEGSVNAWLNDAAEALEIGRRLGEHVIVVGGSTGATLATWLAVKTDVDDVAAFVFLSPNYGVRNPAGVVLGWPWGGTIATWIIGPYRTWEPANEAQARYWTTRYPTRALVPMTGLVNRVNSLDLGRIDRPVLVIYSDDDQVIDPEAVQRRFADIGSAEKRLVAYNTSEAPSDHVLAGAVTAPNDVEPVAWIILEFLYPLLGSAAPPRP